MHAVIDGDGRDGHSELARAELACPDPAGADLVVGSSPSSPESLLGEVLSGRYRVDRIIGLGGMAAVYEGHDLLLARPVALKVLIGRYLYGLSAARFHGEARAAATISHPNVVSVYDVGEDLGWPYMVMELVAGETLADRIRRGQLDPDDVVRLGSDVLTGLAAAHGSGVLHRDIKPANLLLGANGAIKLADFGIAKAMEGDPDPLTLESDAQRIVGTASYLAPERMRGAPASVASDIWAVGVLLYEALTGERPFPGGSPIATALAAEEGRFEPVRVARPDAGPALATAVEAALSPDPANRPQTAADMWRMLNSTFSRGIAQATKPLPLLAEDAYMGAYVDLAERTAPVPVVRSPYAYPLAVRRPYLLPLTAAAVAVLVIGIASLVVGLGGKQPGQTPSVTPAGVPTTAVLARAPTTTTVAVTTTTGPSTSTSPASTSTSSSTTTSTSTTAPTSTTTPTSTTSPATATTVPAPPTTVPATTTTLPAATTTTVPVTTTTGPSDVTTTTTPPPATGPTGAGG